jgi:hypothetical protein
MDARVACRKKYRAGMVQRGGTVGFFLPDREIESSLSPASRE